MIYEKRCTVCEEVKLETEYYAGNGWQGSQRRLMSKCKVCTKLYWKKRAETNKENLLAAGARWRANNPGYMQMYFQNNRDKFYSYKATRRSQMANGDNIDRMVVWGRDEGHCRVKLICDGDFVPFERMHLDHIILLGDGGTHTWNNVRTSCAPCNLARPRKNAPVVYL